jgi:hypothetical protein
LLGGADGDPAKHLPADVFTFDKAMVDLERPSRLS